MATGEEQNSSFPEPDWIDRQLLDLLQADARASFAELSRHVGLSQASIRVRVQRLLASGVLRTVGVVDPATLGIRAMAALGLSTDGASPVPLSKLAEMPEVTFLVATAGRYDAIAEIRCGSDEHLLRTLDQIRSLKGVRRTESGKYLHVAKEAHRRPTPFPAAELDDPDCRLLRELQRDGRASYAQLAQRVGLSQAATRTRALRLIEDGVVRIAALIDPMALGVCELCVFTLNVDGRAGDVAARVAGMAKTDFVAVTAGPWDVLGTLRAGSDEEILEVLDDLRSVPGIRALESHAHLAVAEEQYQRLPPGARSASGTRSGSRYPSPSQPDSASRRSSAARS